MRQDIIKLNPSSMKEKAYVMTNTRRCSSWLDFMLAFMQNLLSIINCDLNKIGLCQISCPQNPKHLIIKSTYNDGLNAS